MREHFTIVSIVKITYQLKNSTSVPNVNQVISTDVYPVIKEGGGK